MDRGQVESGLVKDSWREEVGGRWEEWGEDWKGVKCWKEMVEAYIVHGVVLCSSATIVNYNP